jgi:hypothetical protein
MENKLAHTILKGLCEVRNESNSILGNDNPLTPRALYIIDTMLDLKLHNKGRMNTDIFQDRSDKSGTLKYVNIELTILGEDTNSSIMYMAHHDVNNINSDNCQDNSASVSNLLALAEHFANNKPKKNVHIVFTDCEEFGGKGAERLSQRINEGYFDDVDYVVNLELTANGQNFWADSPNIKDEIASPLMNKLTKTEMIVEVRTPFNDSYVLRHNGIDSICIGSLTDNQMKQVLKTGYCSTWGLCHKADDDFKSAISEDMDKFVELLIKIL